MVSSSHSYFKVLSDEALLWSAGHAARSMGLGWMRSGTLSHAPGGLERSTHIILGENHILWQSADSVGAISDGSLLHLGDA